MKRKSDQSSEEQALNFMHQVKVDGWLDMENEWRGWKLRGPYLVSPFGDRILPQRLIGLLLGESLRKKYLKPRPGAISPRTPDPLPVVVQLPRRRVA